MTREHERLAEDKARTHNWRRWGPFLSERQWGTVREDDSDHGNSWAAFPHDQARRRAYRWGEDGLQGWCDRQCRLCFAPALWNGRDTILKERLFGLGGNEGNHGEDVKECYYYLDSTPSHSYTKALYKYPQRKFPYTELREENQRLGRGGPELELADMGVFESGRYFDVMQEVAKRSPEDLLWRITITNHGPVAAPIHVLPTLWFRNTWSWENQREASVRKPVLKGDGSCVISSHESLGDYRFIADCPSRRNKPKWLFTGNESNLESLSGTPNSVPHVKDAFHRYIVKGETGAVSPVPQGTKAAAYFRCVIAPGASVTIRGRLHAVHEDNGMADFEQFDETFAERIAESDAFYQEVIPKNITDDERLICRQGYAGLLWTKQFFHYVVDEWLAGGATQPTSSRCPTSGNTRGSPHGTPRST